MTDCKKDKEFFSLSLTQPYRSQYGSANPSAILGPAIIATFFSTLAGILFSKIMYLLPEKQEKSTYYKTAYRGAAHHRDAYSKDKGGHIR